MLCLTRRTFESPQISDEITVTVLDIKSGQVRPGIKAPGNVLVLRDELLERIAKERRHNFDAESAPDKCCTATNEEAKRRIIYKRQITRPTSTVA